MPCRAVAMVALLAAFALPATGFEVESRDPAGTPYPWPTCRVVPAAGRTLTDALDRRWVTDLDLANVGAVPTRVSLALLFRGEDNTLAPTAVLAPIPAGSSVSVEDVAALVLERIWQPFLGGIVICAESAPVEAVTRTAWIGPGDGTVGQAIPAYALGETLAVGRTAHLLGLRENAAFRTHLGVFNPNTESVTVRIRLVSPDGADAVTLLQHVPALSQIQINRVLAPHGLEAARAEVSCDDGGVFPYATRVDNETNDSSWLPFRRE